MAELLRQARALQSSAGVGALTDCSVLLVQGEDAQEWLNGQVTNDVRTLSAQQTVYALATSVKGRVLSDMWILRRPDEGFWLIVPTVALETLIDHFNQYILMEDVEVTPDADHEVITMQGPLATKLRTEDDWPCDRLGVGGWDRVLPGSERKAAFAELCERAEALGGASITPPGWELARLGLGVPKFGVDFGPDNYPQEAGLKARAVSFEKGCYLGQEVVCTLEHRGRLNKRLAALSVSATEAPAADAELTTDDGERVGRITSAVREPDGNCLALGYVKRSYAVPEGKLRVAQGTATIRFLVGEPH
jgi:folate-binding protein YgfZ